MSKNKTINASVDSTRNPPSDGLWWGSVGNKKENNRFHSMEDVKKYIDRMFNSAETNCSRKSNEQS